MPGIKRNPPRELRAIPPHLNARVVAVTLAIIAAVWPRAHPLASRADIPLDGSAAWTPAEFHQTKQNNAPETRKTPRASEASDFMHQLHAAASRLRMSDVRPSCQLPFAAIAVPALVRIHSAVQAREALPGWKTSWREVERGLPRRALRQLGWRFRFVGGVGHSIHQRNKWD